jgi:hypothetical protein
VNVHLSIGAYVISLKSTSLTETASSRKSRSCLPPWPRTRLHYFRLMHRSDLEFQIFLYNMQMKLCYQFENVPNNSFKVQVSSESDCYHCPYTSEIIMMTGCFYKDCFEWWQSYTIALRNHTGFTAEICIGNLRLFPEISPEMTLEWAWHLQDQKSNYLTNLMMIEEKKCHIMISYWITVV